MSGGTRGNNGRLRARARSIGPPSAAAPPAATHAEDEGTVIAAAGVQQAAELPVDAVARTDEQRHRRCVRHLHQLRVCIDTLDAGAAQEQSVPLVLSGNQVGVEQRAQILHRRLDAGDDLQRQQAATDAILCAICVDSRLGGRPSCTGSTARIDGRIAAAL